MQAAEMQRPPLPVPLLVSIPLPHRNSWNYEQAFCSDVSPELCLNETFMVAITDAVVSSGMLASGYDIINLSEV